MATNFPLQAFEPLPSVDEPTSANPLYNDWVTFKAEFVDLGDTITHWHLALWNARVGMVEVASTSYIEISGPPSSTFP